VNGLFILKVSGLFFSLSSGVVQGRGISGFYGSGRLARTTDEIKRVKEKKLQTVGHAPDEGFGQAPGSSSGKFFPAIPSV